MVARARARAGSDGGRRGRRDSRLRHAGGRAGPEHRAKCACSWRKWPNSVPAETINRFCSSGLQAIAHAALSVQAGLTQVSVAGGVESMTMVPMSGNKVSLNPKLMDEYPEAYIAMGHTAERVAERFGVSRAATGRVRRALARARSGSDRGRPLQRRDRPGQGARARGQQRVASSSSRSTSARAPARRSRCSAS